MGWDDVVPESYGNAALRHLRDAEYLAARGVYDGAGHLVGFAAECAVKHSVTVLRPLDEAPRLHSVEDRQETARRTSEASAANGSRASQVYIIIYYRENILETTFFR